MKKPYVIGLVVLLILNVLDVATTYYCLSRGALELNPLASFLIESKLLVPSKMLVLTALIVGCWSSGKKLTVPALCGLWFVVGVYALAITLNTVHVVKLI
jgi:hypothetical protein